MSQSQPVSPPREGETDRVVKEVSILPFWFPREPRGFGWERGMVRAAVIAKNISGISELNDIRC